MNKKKSLLSTLSKAAFWSLVTGVGALHFYDAIVNHDRIQYLPVTLRSPKITPSLEGYKIGFITDTHTTSLAKIKDMVEELNKKELDLLLLGGDYHHSGAKTWATLKAISGVKTTDGIYGVDGNHDKHKDLFAAMNTFSMTPLDNQGVTLRPGLFLAGVSDYQYRRPSIKEAIKNRAPDDFVLLLSHNPDITMAQDTRSVDMILCGHTHGGELSLFGQFAPALLLPGAPALGISEHLHRFRTGLCQSKDGRPVYLSHGVGRHGPIRAYCPPQVLIFTLSPELS